MKKILPIFSYIFHPIFIPILGTLLFFSFDNNYYELLEKYIILLQVVIITLFIPITFFYLLKTLGSIDSIMVSEISQRKIPLLIQIILIIILIQKSITIERTPELYFFFLGGLISSILAFILLFAKIKASIHMIGSSALTFFLIGLSIHYQANNIYLISLLFLINGVIASSRLEMKAHNQKELIIGFCIGAIPQTILFLFWL